MRSPPGSCSDRMIRLSIRPHEPLRHHSRPHPPRLATGCPIFARRPLVPTRHVRGAYQSVAPVSGSRPAANRCTIGLTVTGNDVVARHGKKVGQTMIDQRSSTRGSSATRSPLDPFVGPFLRYVATLSDGYAPSSHGRVIADQLDWPPAFVEAVFASARVRGLLETVLWQTSTGPGALAGFGPRPVMDRGGIGRVVAHGFPTFDVRVMPGNLTTVETAGVDAAGVCRVRP